MGFDGQTQSLPLKVEPPEAFPQKLIQPIPSFHAQPAKFPLASLETLKLLVPQISLFGVELQFKAIKPTDELAYPSSWLK